MPAHPGCPALYAVRVPRVGALPRASFRPHLTVTPLPPARGSYHLHPQRTFTFKLLPMPGVHRKSPAKSPGSRLWLWPYGPMLPATGSEAVAAVDRLGAARAERDLGLAAAARARRREHLTGSGGVAATAAAAATHVRGTATEITTLGLSGCAARRAATRLAELSLSEERLLARAEDELLVAVLANQGLVRCVQRTLLTRAASATRLSRREPLRGAIVAAAGFGAYWPVRRSVPVPPRFCPVY